MSTDLSPRIVRACVVALTVVLLVLGVRTVPARLAAVPGDDLREAVLNNDKFVEQDFNSFVHSRETALVWRSTSDYYDELASAYAARAAKEGTSAEDIDRFLELTLDDQRKALRIEPVDAYGWSQMAYLDLQGGLAPEHAAENLRLSFETAPYEPGLLPTRLDMMVELRDALSADEQSQIPFIARQAWDVDRETVAAMAKNHNYNSVIENALSDDPKALDQFHALIADKP